MNALLFLIVAYLIFKLFFNGGIGNGNESYDIARKIANRFNFNVKSLVPPFIINPSQNASEQKKLTHTTDILVRNADGTVTQKNVPVDIPFEEINEIYGHGIHKYNYTFPIADELACINYPSKRWIDSHGSNLNFPNYSCHQNKFCNMITMDPLPNDRELFLADTVKERSVLHKYVHPLSKRIVFTNRSPYE